MADIATVHEKLAVMLSPVHTGSFLWPCALRTRFVLKFREGLDIDTEAKTV